MLQWRSKLLRLRSALLQWRSNCGNGDDFGCKGKAIEEKGEANCCIGGANCCDVNALLAMVNENGCDSEANVEKAIITAVKAKQM